MASVSADANGNRMVQFFGLDRKRKTIRLGKVSDRAAQAIASKVEVIISQKILRQPLEAAEARWVANLWEGDDLKLAKKFVNVGLIEDRKDKATATIGTLGEFADDFLKRVGQDVKPGTLVMYEMPIRNLKKFFGPDKTLKSIHAGDAEDFRRDLRKVEKLASATINRRCQFARAFFKDAVRRRLIEVNPFADIGAGSTANRSRQQFIDQATIQKVIEVCPSAEWRLLVALSRFAGLRVPSEPLLLRWQDIDTVDWKRMTVHSPKTEHHEGHATRIVPIFPELKPYFEDAYELAADGAEWVLPSLRRPGIASGDWRNVNLSRMFVKFIKRAGLEVWPRVFHNLRSSRQTELTDIFPSHVVTAWLGNSEKVADAHYNQVMDAHFEKALQIPVHTSPEMTGNHQQHSQPGKQKTPENHVNTVKSGVCKMSDTGFEPVTSTV